jgi:hypothetical protein
MILDVERQSHAMQDGDGVVVRVDVDHIDICGQRIEHGTLKSRSGLIHANTRSIFLRQLTRTSSSG